MLPAEYKSLKSKLMSELEHIKFISVTTDGWTSSANGGYITVTSHFTYNDFQLKSAVLATKKLLNPTSHTASNVAGTLHNIFLEWGVLHKIQYPTVQRPFIYSKNLYNSVSFLWIGNVGKL